MVWAGPAIDERDESWRRDASLSELVAKLAAPTTDMADAKKDIQAYSDGQAAGIRSQILTNLFAGILATINAKRDEAIQAIARYARRQQNLAAKIERTTAELEGLTREGTPGEGQRRENLKHQVHWDTRIFEERERSLAFVCEAPVLLEQRAFALAREIMGQLD